MLQMQGSAREIALDLVRADGRAPAGARQLRARAGRVRRADRDPHRGVRRDRASRVRARAAPRQAARRGVGGAGDAARPNAAADPDPAGTAPDPGARPGRGLPAGRATATRSAATSTTSSRSARATGSSRSATSAARVSRLPSSPPWPATRCAVRWSPALPRRRRWRRSTRSCSGTAVTGSARSGCSGSATTTTAGRRRLRSPDIRCPTWSSGRDREDRRAGRVRGARHPAPPRASTTPCSRCNPNSHW